MEQRNRSNAARTFSVLQDQVDKKKIEFYSAIASPFFSFAVPAFREILGKWGSKCGETLDPTSDFPYIPLLNIATTLNPSSGITSPCCLVYRLRDNVRLHLNNRYYVSGTSSEADTASL